MKKIYIALLLVLCITVSVSADQRQIIDQAGLLSSQEVEKLETMADSIVENTQMDVVIVTVDSLGGKTAQTYADDYFDYNGYGIGSDHSGVLFLIAMDERQWAVSTCGAAIQALTDREIDDMMYDLTDYLTDGNYYSAFTGFLDTVETEFSRYAEYGEMGDFSFENVIISLVIGAVVGGVALIIMRSNMNTAKQQYGAGSYMCDGSYDLFRCHDIYLYSRTSKVRKPQNNSSGSHRSSSGRSHGGRSGGF